MSAQPRTKNIDQDVERELARRLTQAQAEDKLAEVEIASHLYRLAPMEDIQTTDDPAGS